jgi:hypothetical protein
MIGMLLVLVAASAIGACAQTASELLQKGIYMQETVGDLDGAMKVYRQVVDLTKDSRANAAQAFYRLGVCQQKKGQMADASKTFHQLIQQYPEQTELVASARLALGSELELLPAPWVDGEVTELSVKIGPGKPVGIRRFSIQTSKNNPGNWDIEDRFIRPCCVSLTRTEVDKETMKPVSSLFKQTNLGQDTEISYQPGEAVFKAAGKEPQHLVLKGQEWDNDEAWAMARRLPLAPGYNTTFSVVTGGGGVGKGTLSVSGIEEVETPAGKFSCYKVHLGGALNETLWYSTDGTRYLVKAGWGQASAELKSLPAAYEPAPSTYSNEELGFSFSVPAGWIVEPSELLSSRAKDTCGIQLVKLDSPARVTLVVKVRNGPVQTAEALRAEEQKTEQKKEKDGGDDVGKIRPDSWQTRTIDGRPALTWIEDYVNPVTSIRTTNYHLRIKSHNLNARVILKADPKEFEALRASFDPILDTLKLR